MVTPLLPQQCDVVVLGGGAAGLMCAASAAARGRKVCVIEHSNKVGKKILMSGGGRCNFTNLYLEHNNYICTNPHFCKSALSRYTQWDFINLVEKYQLAYHEKAQGQLFCDDKAKDILNILLAECEKNHVNIQTHCELETIKTIHTDQQHFLLTLRHEKQTINIHCESLVVATGGLSIPSMGASGKGYDIARQFNHTLIPRDAALVPFILDKTLLDDTQALAGISLPVNITCQQQSFQEALLFTHKGLSGPAILQISNYWRQRDPINIDLLPQALLSELVQRWQQQGVNTELKNALSEYLPKRFIALWLSRCEAEHGVMNKPVKQYTPQELGLLDRHFHQWCFTPKGTEGYRTAEVTRGGINTDEVSSKTFESKRQPNLYFIGEVLDVTGWLGGFNFQWAWASGWCAGKYV